MLDVKPISCYMMLSYTFYFSTIFSSVAPGIAGKSALVGVEAAGNFYFLTFNKIAG